MFSPAGKFIKQVLAISVSRLPKEIKTYINKNYKGASVNKTGRETDASGKMSYEAEVNGNDVIFYEKGNFVKTRSE